MTRWDEEKYDPIVRSLRSKGRPPKTILEFMLDSGHAVSLRDVRDAITRLGLAKLAPRPTTWAGPPVQIGRLNPMEEARRLLNERLTERDGAYCLDGRGVNLIEIMREVNRIRRAEGCNQIVHSPQWCLPE